MTHQEALAIVRKVWKGEEPYKHIYISEAFAIALEDAYNAGRKSMYNPDLEWALNSGDGTYKP